MRPHRNTNDLVHLVSRRPHGPAQRILNRHSPGRVRQAQGIPSKYCSQLLSLRTVARLSFVAPIPRICWRVEGSQLGYVRLLIDRNTHLRFSPLYSFSRNFENWSRPTGSFSSSLRSKPQRLTRRNGTSLLLQNVKEKPQITDRSTSPFQPDQRPVQRLTWFSPCPIARCCPFATDSATPARWGNNQIQRIARNMKLICCAFRIHVLSMRCVAMRCNSRPKNERNRKKENFCLFSAWLCDLAPICQLQDKLNCQIETGVRDANVRQRRKYVRFSRFWHFNCSTLQFLFSQWNQSIYLFDWIVIQRCTGRTRTMTWCTMSICFFYVHFCCIHTAGHRTVHVPKCTLLWI